MITRVPRELGRPCRLHRRCRPETRLTNSRMIHGPASGAAGDEPGTQRWYRQAKETKCGEMGGRESERLIVPSSRGNRPEGPRGGKGTPSHEPLEGNMTGTPRPETVSTKRQRIAELARDCPGHGVHEPGASHRPRMAADSLSPDPQGRGGRRGRTDRGRIRGQPDGQPSGPPRPRQVRHVRGTARATSAHPQGGLAQRDPSAGDTDVRGQDPPTCGADGAGAGVRDGLSGRLARIPPRTRCSRGLGVAVEAGDEAGRRLDRGRRSAEVLRHDRPRPSTGVPQASGARWCDPAI